MNPRIGIALPSDNVLHSYRADLACMKAVSEVGGEPIVISPLPDSDFSNILSIMDGVILLGGDHSHLPSGEGAKTNSGDEPSAEKRAELELAKEVIVNTKLPVLGICSGSRLLNEVLGGKFEDHIKRKAALLASRDVGSETMIEIDLESGSRLSEIYRKKVLQVPLFHFLSVKTLGDGLKISAEGQDGVAEAFETGGNRFLLGVNWHPEFDMKQNLPLFESFMTACSRKLQLS